MTPPLASVVRRLAVAETCRLMGFPDDYLDVDGADTPDAPRYKACGNSWAVNCAELVNARVERALRETGAVAPGASVRYATTCSGVEAHSLSVRGADWTPQFFSEIDKFPCRVLAHRYPSVPNLGDIAKVDGNAWRLDVFSGGTPCQSLSVAGKRHGMAEGSGTRSSLAFHWLRLANETRAHVALWENVPGAFTANGGRDFAWFVFRLAEAGWGVAWRVLDAQYCPSWSFPRAVPQRRKRIWLVACRDGNWRMAARILFERRGRLAPCPPLRVLGDGTAVAERGETRFGADGKPFSPLTRRSRADWLPVGFFGGAGAPLAESRLVLSRLGEVRYCGGMFEAGTLFGGGAAERPDGLANGWLAAVGAGSGVACGRTAVALKTPPWPAGIQPPWRVLAEADGVDAAVTPPPEYDGTVCGLSDVLLPWGDALRDLLLSKRACEGILRRAAKRGRPLNPILTETIAEQIRRWDGGAAFGGGDGAAESPRSLCYDGRAQASRAEVSKTLVAGAGFGGGSDSMPKVCVSRAFNFELFSDSPTPEQVGALCAHRAGDWAVYREFRPPHATNSNGQHVAACVTAHESAYTQNLKDKSGGYVIQHPPVFALDGDKWKVRRDDDYARKGGNGLGVNEAEVMYTLTTADRHAVAVCRHE